MAWVARMATQVRKQQDVASSTVPIYSKPAFKFFLVNVIAELIIYPLACTHVQKLSGDVPSLIAFQPYIQVYVSINSIYPSSFRILPNIVFVWPVKFTVVACKPLRVLCKLCEI